MDIEEFLNITLRPGSLSGTYYHPIVRLTKCRKSVFIWDFEVCVQFTCPVWIILTAYQVRIIPCLKGCLLKVHGTSWGKKYCTCTTNITFILHLCLFEAAVIAVFSAFSLDNALWIIH